MDSPEGVVDVEKEPINPQTELLAVISKLPELQGRKESLLETALELDQRFQLKPEFYDDSLRNFFFIALADRLAKVRQAEHLSPQQKIQEEYFVSMALPMLAMKKSGRYDELKQDINSEPELSPEEITLIYDKYTNTELTTELRQAIDDGLLQEVQQRLGFADQPQDFELRVLEIGDGYSTSGMAPPRPKADYAYPPTAEWEEYNRQYQDFKQKVDQWTSDANSFVEARGIKDDSIPLAWVEEVGGKKVLCLPAPVAEKILRPNQYYKNEFDKGQRERDFAVLNHEFVHTQNPLSLDYESFYGITLEERRAEFFSGDRMGYLDVKGFLLDLSVVTGFNALEWLERNKAGDRADAFIEIANTIGVQATLELGLVVPKSYVKATRKYQMRTAEYLGSPDSFLERLYELGVANGQEQEISNRIEEQVLSWVERGRDIDFIKRTRASYSGLEFMTSKYYQAYQESALSATTTRQ